MPTRHPHEAAAHLVTRLSTTPTGQQVLSPVDLVWGDPAVLGQNVFVLRTRGASELQGLVGSVPEGNCVFILPTGGFPTQRFLADTVTADLPAPQDWPGVYLPTLQYVIVSPKNDPDAGFELAEAVLLGVDKSPPPGYFSQVVVGGQVTLDTPFDLVLLEAAD